MDRAQAALPEADRQAQAGMTQISFLHGARDRLQAVAAWLGKPAAKVSSGLVYAPLASAAINWTACCGRTRQPASPPIAGWRPAGRGNADRSCIETRRSAA
jgi:hypothetical protein